MSKSAILAIKATKGVKSWGKYAALKFCTNNNVHPALFRLARQLEAVKGF